ncbi:hypothetical protein C7446_0323 [Kushneria sinocarnis]|uniref:Uncharacterized protein n=1 Tax=Kushneria sinocarnis TaxID=595502 RepID=A0A420X0Y2_9GAMM|nr:hypothetical protein [Kushneria sinocarnis]RKR07511.1 hypothetical protein C7446_0323 [Kushneria sinocarnis]
MLPSFRLPLSHRLFRVSSLFQRCMSRRAERAAHRRLLAAAAAFVEEPGVQRLDRLQAAVRYSQYTLEPEHD